MIKRMNRRGEEGTGLGTFLGIVLGGAAVVLVIIGFTIGWDKILGYIQKSDVDVAVMSEKCSALMSNSAGYCADRMKIATNSYVNCPYAVVNLGVRIEGTAPTCVGTIGQVDDAGAIAICEKLKLELGTKYTEGMAKKVKVNGQTCYALKVIAEATTP